MTAVSDAAAQAAIGAAARELHLPTVRDQATRLAEIATREHATYLAYLAEVHPPPPPQRPPRGPPPPRRPPPRSPGPRAPPPPPPGAAPAASPKPDSPAS